LFVNVVAKPKPAILKSSTGIAANAVWTMQKKRGWNAMRNPRYVGAITNVKMKGAQFLGVFENNNKGYGLYALPIKKMTKIKE
jgi:hypothetical protein